MGLFTKTATASGFSFMVRSKGAVSIASAIPILSFTSGSTYTGTAPQITRALITLLWTFLGRMILSPLLQTDKIMLCTADVVPPIIKKACSAINASAASSSASLMTETGWHRLSKGFMEFTSSPTHFSPKSSTSSGFPLPLLCPGTSNGTTLFFLNFSRAS